MLHNKRPLMFLLVTIVGSSLVIQQSVGMPTKAYSTTTLPIQGDTPSGEEFLAERDNPDNNIPGEAVLVIHSDTQWSGSILDTNFDSATIDGSGHDKIQFLCNNGEIYSLAFQKQTDFGYLSLFLIQEGDAIDMKFTTADYGMVSLSGTC